MIYISRETLRAMLYRYKVYNTRLQMMCNDMYLLYYKEFCDKCPYMYENRCSVANRLRLVR